MFASSSGNDAFRKLSMFRSSESPQWWFGWPTALLFASPARIWSRTSGEARFVPLRFRYSAEAKMEPRPMLQP